MKQSSSWISIVIAAFALIATSANVYFAHSSYVLNQGTQKAAIFSQFQQQYTAIEGRFPALMQKPDFRPAVGSDDFRKLQDYWIFCYAEWYETNIADPASYNDLWVNYYSDLILNAMDIPSLRYTLVIMMRDYGVNRKYMQEFYSAMRRLAADAGKPLSANAPVIAKATP
jgi:hypothetical protein